MTELHSQLKIKSIFSYSHISKYCICLYQLFKIYTLHNIKIFRNIQYTMKFEKKIWTHNTYKLSKLLIPICIEKFNYRVILLILLRVILRFGLFCSSLCSLNFFPIEPSGFETDLLFFINFCDLKYSLNVFKTMASIAGICRKLYPKHKPIQPPIFPIRV